MSEQDQPAADGAKATPEQPALNYDGESLDDLEARFRAGEGILVERDDEPAPEPETQEPEAAEEAQAEPEAQAEEVREEPESEPEPKESGNAEALEELRLQLELERSARERSELIGGRAAAQLGELRKQVEMLTQTRQQPPPTPDDDYGVPQQQAPPYSYPGAHQPSGVDAIQEKVAGLEAAERARAIEAELQSFKLKNFGDDENAYQQFVESSKESLSASLAPYQNLPLDNAGARKLLNISLNIALTEHRLAQRKRDAQERVAQQVPEKKRAKQAATVSGSGAASVPKSRPKSPEEMTAEEADAELIKLYGDGHYRRRVR